MALITPTPPYSTHTGGVLGSINRGPRYRHDFNQHGPRTHRKAFAARTLVPFPFGHALAAPTIRNSSIRRFAGRARFAR